MSLIGAKPSKKMFLIVDLSTYIFCLDLWLTLSSFFDQILDSERAVPNTVQNKGI